MGKIRKLYNDTESTKNIIEKIDIKEVKLTTQTRVKKIVTLLTNWAKHN